MKQRTIEALTLIALIGIVGSFIGLVHGFYEDWESGNLKGVAFYFRLFLFLSFPYFVTIILCSYVARRKDRRRTQTKQIMKGEARETGKTKSK